EDLYRLAAAEDRDAVLGFSIQRIKLPLSAHRTERVRLNGDHPRAEVPGGEQGLLPRQGFLLLSGEIAEGYRGLPGRRDAGGGPQDAPRVAGGEDARGRQLIELAAEAGSAGSGEELDMSRAPDGAGINPWDLQAIADVVQ